MVREFLDHAFWLADEIVQYFDFVLSCKDMSKSLIFDDLDKRKKEKVNAAMAIKTSAKGCKN